MINGFLKRSFLNQKAAQKCVAFFIIFFLPIVDVFSSTKGTDDIKIMDLKTKSAQFLIDKNRASAIRLINDTLNSYLGQSNPNKETLEKIYILKENALSIFLTQESQDLFESSASSLFQNTRLSEKKVNACLQIEPENLYCRWQLLRFLKYKNSPEFSNESERFIKDAEKLPLFSALAQTLSTKKQLVPLSFSDFENKFPVLYYIIEYERSLTVKNYSLSKDLVQTLSALAGDYPDIILMRAQLASLSAENNLEEKSNSLHKTYKKKCSTLSAELTRKYYYDINLCHRGI